MEKGISCVNPWLHSVDKINIAHLAVTSNEDFLFCRPILVSINTSLQQIWFIGLFFFPSLFGVFFLVWWVFSGLFVWGFCGVFLFFVGLLVWVFSCCLWLFVCLGFCCDFVCLFVWLVLVGVFLRFVVG